MTTSTETDTALDAVRASVRTIDVIDERDGVKLTRIILEPGEEVPWHRHTAVTDTFYAVTGPVTIETREPEGARDLQTGDVFQAKAGQPHRVSNQSDHTVSFLLIQGGGMFDFVPVET